MRSPPTPAPGRRGKRALAAGIALLALLAAGGCGNKGSLYLPPEPDDEKKRSQLDAPSRDPNAPVRSLARS
jgi:predicted small lipoprotein YifL